MTFHLSEDVVLNVENIGICSETLINKGPSVIGTQYKITSSSIRDAA